MTPPDRSLARWLTTPSTVAAIAGAGVAAFSFAMTAELPEGGVGTFWVVVAVAVVLSLAASDVYEQSTLKALRALERRASPAPSVDMLAAAARAVARSADVAFSLTFTLMPVGACFIALAWWSVARPPEAVLWRLVFTTFAMTPLTSLLAHVAVLPRARSVLSRLVERGLPIDEAYRAGPGRFELRRRMLLFTAIAVATPMFLVTDVSLRRFDALVQSTSGGTPSTTVSMLQLAVLVVVVVGLVTTCAWLVGTALTQPLRALAGATQQLARGGPGAKTLVAAEHELWAAAGALASMGTHVGAALNDLQRTADDTGAVAERLLQGSQQQLRWTDEQATALAATSGTTTQMAQSARHIEGQATAVAVLAQETLAAAREGEANAEAFTHAMAVLRSGNQSVADEVVRLNGRLQHVAKVVDFITGIADKADVLALNAELEGHKAGEVGQGFGLVAAEMRRLAERVTLATQEIRTLIDDVRDAANAAVMATEAGVKATDAGTAVAVEVRESLRHIVGFAGEASDACDAIRLATAQQRTGTEELASAVGSVVDSTQRGAATVRDMVALTHALQAVVAQLHATVAGAQGGA